MIPIILFYRIQYIGSLYLVSTYLTSLLLVFSISTTHETLFACSASTMIPFRNHNTIFGCGTTRNLWKDKPLLFPHVSCLRFNLWLNSNIPRQIISTTSDFDANSSSIISFATIVAIVVSSFVFETGFIAERREMRITNTSSPNRN